MKPLESRARFAIVVLVVIAVVDVFAVWVDLDRYDLLDRIVNNGNFTIEEADTSDSRNAAVAVLQLTLLALGAVGFLLWFVRAYGNVTALGSSRRFSVKWAGWAGSSRSSRSGARNRSRTTSGAAAIPSIRSKRRTRTRRSRGS
jgi:hypothetical protein